MKVEDLSVRERQLYECNCPVENPCRKEDCAAYRAYYDALFAGKTQAEAEDLAARTVKGIRKGIAEASPPRKPDGCKYLGEWQGKTCDEKT